jgi:hypothetical protein
MGSQKVIDMGKLMKDRSFENNLMLLNLCKERSGEVAKNVLS